MPGDDLTHGPPATKKQAAVTTGMAGSSGIPCAMGYGLYALSPGTGFIAPVRAMRLVRRSPVGEGGSIIACA
jgi:hypothetical protein